MKKILIIGAGISGLTLAERFSNIANREVLVLEKRDHIGGNCYDYYNDEGLLVPKYGPHFFHTNDEDVWEYVNQFSEWVPYEHRVLSNVDGTTLVPVPVNIVTVNTLFGTNITTAEEMREWLDRNTEKISNPQNSEEASLRRVGKVLYEKMFKYYTKKQWDMWPSELGPEVMDRIPVRDNFDDRYFADVHQAMPKEGYTKLFEKMTHNKNITIKTGVEFTPEAYPLEEYEYVFYSGRIDAFFGNMYGQNLQYRSLRFEMETLDQEWFQPATTVNYPNTEAFTRITEPKHSTGQKHDKTVIIKEYSTWDGEPYYPVPSVENKLLYAKYQAEAKKLEEKNIYFVGRLAEYKYFNMDQAFKNALDLFNRLKIKF